MKKIIFSAFGVLFVSFMLTNISEAQILLPDVTVTAKNVPVKVDEAFQSSFNDAENPEWYKANKNYLVKFLMNDMKNQAVYKKNGNIVYHISYGFEKDVPEAIANMLKDKYADYNITVAFNVKQDERDIWVINMENEKRIVKVRVEDGVMNEAERIRKSK